MCGIQALCDFFLSITDAMYVCNDSYGLLHWLGCPIINKATRGMSLYLRPVGGDILQCGTTDSRCMTLCISASSSTEKSVCRLQQPSFYYLLAVVRRV